MADRKYADYVYPLGVGVQGEWPDPESCDACQNDEHELCPIFTCPCTHDLAAENTRLRQQIADLETEANTLAASLRLAATLIRPNRESQ